jgi:integrase
MTDEEKTNEEKKSRSRKQKRRGKGEGSIYPDKKNDRWVGSFFTGGGKRRYVYGKTQEEAREKLRAAQHADQQGSLATGPQQTVKQFLEHWLEEVHKPAIRISSYVLYRGMLDNHILPELEQYKLRQLTVGHVDSFYAKKARQGLSASTIKVLHGVLHSALAHAVTVNLVVRNVSAIAKKSLPRQTRYEIAPLTKEQAHLLLEHARGEQSEALLILALTTGMRRGELVALRWSDIHFEEAYLQIRRSARTAAHGYGLQITEPKTRSSRRKIVLSPLVTRALTQHRVRQEEAREAAANAWQASDLVFCGRHGEYLDPDTLRNWLKKILKEAGLPSIRFHDLRHSAATLLMEMGVHVKVVKELLGHSNASMTLNVYSHVLPSLQQDAMQKLSDLLSDQGKEQRGATHKQDPQDTDGHT